MRSSVHEERAVATSVVALKSFLAARDFLLAHREDYETACRGFRWPQLDTFNWALDYFDVYARGNAKPALRIVDDNGPELTLSYDEMSQHSNRVANFLREHGMRRRDRIVVQLSNQVAMWEIMLAAMKLGAVVIPAATQLTVGDLRDRLQRGEARHLVTEVGLIDKHSDLGGDHTRIVVGGSETGYVPYARAYDSSPRFAPDTDTSAN